MRIQWTQDKIDFIIEQYTTQKMNTNQLAKYFGCSDDTISRRLKENGIIPHKFYEDLTGKTFGKLTVLQRSPKKERKIYWDCECECGNHVTVVGDALRQGTQLSCGCLHSKTERLIADILRANNILFVQQYSFKDLTSSNGTKYRFDFGIIENNQLSYLIECDGELHFKERVQQNGWNTEENFNKTVKRDLIKNNYCLQNNIPLIRIPYTHKNKITIEDLLLATSKFIFHQEEGEL